MADLQDKARRHLWGHFTRLGALPATTSCRSSRAARVLRVRPARRAQASTGCRGCSSCRPVTGGASWRRRAPRRPRRSTTSRSGRTGTNRRSSSRRKLAELAPGDLNRVFFTTGGSEAVESAWKLARQYFRAIGEPSRYKVIARRTAYHGTTLGALAITGVPAFRAPFEPLVPGGVHVMNTNRYRHPLAKDDAAFAQLRRRRDRGGDPLRGAGDRRRGVPRTGAERRAGASRRRTGTSSGCARSATATACCSSPTR